MGKNIRKFRRIGLDDQGIIESYLSDMAKKGWHYDLYERDLHVFHSIEGEHREEIAREEELGHTLQHSIRGLTGSIVVSAILIIALLILVLHPSAGLLTQPDDFIICGSGILFIIAITTVSCLKLKQQRKIRQYREANISVDYHTNWKNTYKRTYILNVLSFSYVLLVWMNILFK